MAFPNDGRYVASSRDPLLHLTKQELRLLYRTSQTLVPILVKEQLSIVNNLLFELNIVVKSAKAFLWLVEQENVDPICPYGVDCGHNPVVRAEEDFDVGLVHSVIKSGASATIHAKIADNTPVCSALCVPVKAKEIVVGVIEVWHHQKMRFTLRQVRFVEAFAGSLGSTIDNIKTTEHLRSLAQEQVRQRLAANLHDAVNQSLFSASLIAEVLPQLWEKNSEEGRLSLHDLRILIRGAFSELRGILNELRPTLMTNRNLPALLRQLSDAFTSRTHVPVVIDATGQGNVPILVQDIFYKICYEALTNIAKHANASHVTIQLQYDRDNVYLRIKDDGVGFDLGELQTGKHGLEIMRERSQGIGGQLEFASTPGQGTELVWSWTSGLAVEVD